MTGMEIPQKYVLTPDTLYFDEYGIMEEKAPLKEQFLLAVYEQDASGGIRFCFSLGKDKQCLTTFERGKEIECLAGYGWNCIRTLDEEGQRVYWDLEKKQEEKEYYEPCVWVLFSNIAVKKEGITYLEITNKQKMSKEYISIIKTQLPPSIVRFTPVAATVRKGQKAVLKWETLGAANCVINPGNYVVAASGTMEVVQEESMVYTLDAIGGEKRETKTTRVYLFEEVMEDYLTAEPETYYRGSAVTVFYKIGNRKGNITLKAGGAPVCIKPEDNRDENMEASFISSETIAFSYMEKGEKKARYLTLSPDERQVIMKYVVAAKRREGDGSCILFGLEWSTKGAAQIQIFVRVYFMEEKRFPGGFQEYLISAGEEEGIVSWTPDFSNHAVYFFFLRAKNSQGEMKEAVCMYEDEREVGYYDNLGE